MSIPTKDMSSKDSSNRLKTYSDESDISFKEWWGHVKKGEWKKVFDTEVSTLDWIKIILLILLIFVIYQGTQCDCTEYVQDVIRTKYGG